MNDWAESDFRKSTASFMALYEQITARLRQCKEGLEETEKPWLEFLIVGFEKRFWGWRTNQVMRPYLDKLDQKSSKSAILRLIGHAYLHIAYDLPIVIADSIQDKEDAFHARAHHIYRSLDSEFGEVFIQCCKQNNIVGGYGWLAKIAMFFVPRRVEAFAVLIANWAIRLRSESWFTARILHSYGQTQQRRALERELGRLIHQSGNKVFTMSSSPEEWMRFLDPPVLLIFPEIQFETQIGEGANRHRRLSKSEEDRPSDFV